MAHGIPDWVERTKALGNALIPQIAEWIGHRILVAEGYLAAEGLATDPPTPGRHHASSPQ